ncbi:MAG: electron transfer flavoprotein subunit alpha/FixB family protein [Candidatus Sericytochromatia bacterium]|nr:electron transfer flavoprotein subunit alpha/FixB family protein [Candidatus Sericytochromatia bacterium]
MSNSGIWVVAEQQGNAIDGTTLELLGKAYELGRASGQPVHVFLLGHGFTSAAASLGDRGADQVWALDHAELATYRAESFGAAVAHTLGEQKPSLALFSATSSGRDMSAYAAAALKSAVAPDATGIIANEGQFNITRPIYGGNVLATLSTAGTTALVTVLPKAFEAAATGAGRAGTLQSVNLDPALLAARAQVKSFVEEVASGKINLTDAEVVVAGGRGVGGADKFGIIEDLARALGAAVGASRAVTDAGWRPANEQIGQTGVTVKPKLYIAAGISGAVQHWVGMKEAGYIVAINTDADAPIMKQADLAIVGDLFKVIPEMVKEINAAKGVAA